MKKNYSTPIAEWMDAEMDFVLAGASVHHNVDTEDEYETPGSGGDEWMESRPGEEFDGSLAKGNAIFDF